MHREDFIKSAGGVFENNQYYGFDHEKEWVIPLRTQGDLARSILYMCLIYEGLDNFREDFLSVE